MMDCIKYLIDFMSSNLCMIVTCHANHDSNLCMEGSPKQKHDWLPLKRFLSSKYLKSKLNIIFSNILPQTGNNDSGW